jgi:hypothetical protein
VLVTPNDSDRTLAARLTRLRFWMWPIDALLLAALCFTHGSSRVRWYPLSGESGVLLCTCEGNLGATLIRAPELSIQQMPEVLRSGMYAYCLPDDIRVRRPTHFVGTSRSAFRGAFGWRHVDMDTDDFALLALATLGLAVFYRSHVLRRRRQRLQRNLCLVCGYPKAHLTGALCPECGTPLIV